MMGAPKDIPDDLLGKNGILKQLTKRVVERALQAERLHHLGHEKHGKVGNADATPGMVHPRSP